MREGKGSKEWSPRARARRLSFVAVQHMYTSMAGPLNICSPLSRVLVHCHQGVSRSCSYCIAYAIARRGLTYEQVGLCGGGCGCLVSARRWVYSHEHRELVVFVVWCRIFGGILVAARRRVRACFEWES